MRRGAWLAGAGALPPLRQHIQARERQGACSQEATATGMAACWDARRGLLLPRLLCQLHLPCLLPPTHRVHLVGICPAAAGGAVEHHLWVICIRGPVSGWGGR